MCLKLALLGAGGGGTGPGTIISALCAGAGCPELTAVALKAGWNTAMLCR